MMDMMYLTDHYAAYQYPHDYAPASYKCDYMHKDFTRSCSYDGVNFMGHGFDYDNFGAMARMDAFGRGKTGRAKGREYLKKFFFHFSFFIC